MKNYRITFYGLFALLLLSFNACNDEFLDKYPLDQISSAIYFKHASDFELYANQFYPKVFWDNATGDTNEGWNAGIYDGDLNSDNMIRLGEPDSRLAGYNSVPSSGGGWDYSLIRDVNYGIANIGKCEDDPSQVNQYIGELYFFRAFFYFELVKKFGDVPWVDKPLTPQSEELYAPRTPRTEVVQHIISDLDSAAMLMNSGKMDDGTRLSKEVALAFLSRVALYEGTWEKYHKDDIFKGSTDGTEFLQKAAKAAEAVINSGIYSIHNTGNPGQDYFDLFVQTDYAGWDEVMLYKKYDRSIGFVHHHHVASRYPYQKGPTHELAASYLSLDGLPRSVSPDFDETQCDTTATYEARHLDPRFGQTFASSDAIWGIDGDVVTYWYDPDVPPHSYMRCVPQIIDAAEGRGNTPTGYIRRKAFSPRMDIWKSWADEDFGVIFIRYAEVLLNYAEAKAELGTIAQSDIDKSINVLRDRVAMPHLNLGSIVTDPNWDFPSLSPAINEIRRERRVEMAFEGFRLDDVLRWAAADELITGKTFKGVLYNNGDSRVPVDANDYVDRLRPQLPDGYGFRLDRDYLNAIPNDQLTLNPNLEQNPGW
jgi:hypothetical protein